MKFLKAYILPILAFTLVLSCQSKEKDTSVKIRGKIVNPRNNQVVISRDFLGITADTLLLQHKNEVNSTINCPEEGLYFLFIYPEFQTIYLKPGDSLAFHINIDEFDESISFSGNLAFENNLLIELFLLNEKESDYFYRKKLDFDLDKFQQKLDSFHQLSGQIISKYQDELVNSSEKFHQILNLYRNSINFALKEQYIKRHPDTHYPEAFTNYRKILQSKIADPNIIYMYAFTDTYIESKIQRTKKEDFYKEIARQFEDKIADTRFKNNMLTKYCIEYIKEQQISQKDSVVATYFSYINNPLNIDKCKGSIQKNKILQTGSEFPNVKLRTPNMELIDLQKVLSKKQVLISFWDFNKRRNFISNLKKLEKIKLTYPELNIIIINTNPDEFDTWKAQIPNNKNFAYYQLTEAQDAEQIKPYKLAQIFITKDDTIQVSMLNMYAPRFSKELKEKILNN